MKISILDYSIDEILRDFDALLDAIIYLQDRNKSQVIINTFLNNGLNLIKHKYFQQIKIETNDLKNEISKLSKEFAKIKLN